MRKKTNNKQTNKQTKTKGNKTKLVIEMSGNPEKGKDEEESGDNGL